MHQNLHRKFFFLYDGSWLYFKLSLRGEKLLPKRVAVIHVQTRTLQFLGVIVTLVKVGQGAHVACNHSQLIHY